jgi:RNA polymerase sigma factor (sigma-70 family)
MRLMGIALKVIYGRLRDETKRRPAILQSGLPTHIWDGLEDREDAGPAVRAANRLDAQKAMMRLDGLSRQVLHAYYFQGLKGEDLAQRLGISKRAVQQRFFRALQRLKILFPEEQLVRPDDHRRES